ncbi:hypothetical protein MTO96_048862 [Rhipicephalus appendiculatus]
MERESEENASRNSASSSKQGGSKPGGSASFSPYRQSDPGKETTEQVPDSAQVQELERCCSRESKSSVALKAEAPGDEDPPASDKCIALASGDQDPPASDRCIALLHIAGAVMALAIACALVLLIAGLFAGLRTYLPRMTRARARPTKGPSLT